MAGWACLAPVAFVDVINSHMTVLDLPPDHIAAWSVLYALTGAALWSATKHGTSARRRWSSWWVFAVASSLAMQIFTAGGNLGGFLIMSAGIAAGIMGTWPLIGAIGVQSLLFLFALQHDLSWSGSLFLTLVFIVFQGFTAMLVKVSQQEYDLRQALASSNAHLRFTQALLTHTAADTERRRISRELHDGLGHQLTLLSLELELAYALGDAETKQTSLERARRLNHGAIDLVRDNVQELRLSCWEDLYRVQRAVSAAAPSLALTLQLPDPLPELPAPLVHLCLRFLQESVSNTIKYAGASLFEFELDLQADQLVLTAGDNGKVLNLPRARAGFGSLRERVEALGGRFHVILAAQEPVRLRALVPLEQLSLGRA